MTQYTSCAHHRKRVRKRPLGSTTTTTIISTTTTSPKKRIALIIATLLSATTILSPVLHIHALLTPKLSPTITKRQLPPTSTIQLHSTVRGGAAAAGWLFTPDRTASALADTVGDAAISTVSAVADVALEAAAYAADTAATVTTDTVVQTIYKAPFLSLAISFIAGGLLFSTVAAFVAATYSFGKENSRRLREVAGILMRRNWSVIRMQWMFTLDVLRGKEKISGFKNRFPAALQTFKDGFAEVKRVFTESVDALKKESQMYSAAVGVPGLIPIQYIFERIFPTLLTAPFQGALQDSLVNLVNDNNQIRSLVLKKFSMGDIAPRILEAKLFDLGNSDMAFDLDMRWRSNIRADLEMRVTSFGTKIPVTIQNLRFEGPVRLILVGLMPQEPGWEALLISFPRPPTIGFDLKVAGGLITQIPWLRNEVAKNLDNAVAQEMLWPRRAVVSAPAPFKPKPLLNPMQMLSLMRDDPLLRRERELMNSIPDEFRNSLDPTPDPSDIDVDVRQVNDTKGNDEEEDVNGGNTKGGGLGQRLRFWKRSEQYNTQTVDMIQQMVDSLKEEATSTGRPMPVMIIRGAEERKGLLGRVLSNVLIPRSLLSYATREAG
ncbi:synaptotagmin-related protein [Skeletonema marinoi]|uniref:Synaptotagmin-related protein n=1 Tax=Skeletonema marinoi TaxID=267567 RepID=A0AAD8YAJ7_9STRA|nr:synaptotagmin-related protein [Skeletonema marinoi]